MTDMAPILMPSVTRAVATATENIINEIKQKRGEKKSRDVKHEKGNVKHEKGTTNCKVST